MFHVFVEGARDATPQGLAQLAQAIGAHYGISAADLLVRLKAGRFRVKGNVDRATAETYLRDLERLGARCTVEAATAANSRPTPPAGLPATTLPPISKAATPPAGTPAARPSQPNQFASGLSAAFSGEMPQADLGAFEKLEAGALSLASVDGSDGSGPVAAPVSFEPPAAAPKPAPGAAPAGNQPAGKPAANQPAGKPAAGKPADKKPRPKDEPLDLFVPPDAGADLKVDLATEDDEHFARKKAATPPAATPVVETPASRKSQPPATTDVRKSQPLPTLSERRSQPIAVPSPAAARGNPLADERVRLVAGVLLAILLGFVPAHFIARAREQTVYVDIDHKVEAAQSLVTTQDEYAALDKRRDSFLAEKSDARRNIVILAFLIWGAAGAAIAYVWFRRIPWDQDSGSSESESASSSSA